MIAEVVRTGSVIVAGVTFDRDRTQPAASSDPALDELRAVLLEHMEWTFEVQVHTDETDTPDKDLSLSSARADAVVRWLVTRGIEERRLVPRGYGRSRPLRTAPAGDPTLQHRRVELRKLNEE
jgi:outer membrane protein OmpA-like peptidoglycan-associated protein